MIALQFLADTLFLCFGYVCSTSRQTKLVNIVLVVALEACMISVDHDTSGNDLGSGFYCNIVCLLCHMMFY